MNEKKVIEDEIKVSVIIPVYNVEKYLEECIESILGQTLSDINILLIDDGSTDLSGDICEKYANDYSNIDVIHKINEGQGTARNIGFSKAMGKYVYFMDSDDILEKDALCFLYNEAEKKKLDVILFAADCFCDELEIHFNSDEYKKTQFLNQVMPGDELFKGLYSAHEYSCSIPMRFYDKEFLEKNDFKFPQGIIHEDEIYGFLSLVKAKRAECVEQRFYKRRYRSGSTMTGKKAYNSAKGYAYTWKALLEAYRELGVSREKVYYNFADDFMKLIIQLYYSSFTGKEKNRFKKERYELLNIIDFEYKEIYGDAALFLRNPFIYRQHKRIKNFLRERNLA